MSGAITAAQEFGLSVADASRLFGEDLAEELQHARTALDAALPEVGRATQIDPVELELVRARVDAHAATELEVKTYFRGAMSSVRKVWDEGLAELDRGAAKLRSEGLSAAIGALHDASEAAAIGWDRQGAASSVAVSRLTSSDETIADVAAAEGLYRKIAASLTSDLTGAASRAWQDEVVNDPDARSFDEWVVSLLAPSATPSTIDLAAIATKFHSGLVLQEHLAHVADLAKQHVLGVTDDIQRTAERTLQTYLLAAGAVILGTLVGTARLARAVARPLRLLSARAHDVSAGSLDGVPLPLAGPREVAESIEAFNDATTNLGHLYAGVVAMAAGSTDDAALAAPPVGELGRTLAAALSQLSESIQERSSLQAALEAQAMRDELTGLPNRRLIMEQLGTMVRQADRSGAPITVLFLDLDRFKEVNDAHGHAAGDHVLKTTADRLTQICRRSDFVGRLGGDEFVVITQCSALAAVPLQARIERMLASPIELANGDSVTCPPSIGVADTAAGHTPDALLAAADQAMYLAKEHRLGVSR